MPVMESSQFGWFYYCKKCPPNPPKSAKRLLTGFRNEKEAKEAFSQHMSKEHNAN